MSAPAHPVRRHALDGALAALAALAVMAATAWAALALLGADSVAPLSRLVPTLVSLAVGGGVTLESSGGELPLTLTGEATLTPLGLTFLGTAVLATVFFRPLRHRARPTPAMLWARCGGALAGAAVTLPVCASLARGTAELPESVRERIGDRGGSGRFGGGRLTEGLDTVTYRTDVLVTALLGLLGVAAVLAVGCLAARRTALPHPLALSGLRTKWHPVLSTLTGTATVLCCATVAVGALAGARDARAAGALLLAGPNLLAALLTSGMGTSWEAGVRRLRPDGGGLLGMLTSRQADGPAREDRTVDLGHWAGAGLPLWLLGVLLALLLLTAAGYVATARTPRRDPGALLDRHTDTALRTGIAVGILTFVLPYLARGSLHIGVSLMGNEMGGVDAGLTTGPRLSALTAFVAAALSSYGGGRLRARLRPAPPPAPRRRAARPVRSPEGV
ncbi:hypothetical protein Stsp02_38440 [Streptomyces sp. NBRC 14336]|uniref:streptophobe family protein n=1 Tax=Streptomyces sp. NBRC 14336 TaxID=3030992 RepID=UPI0024A49F57|nr:streptophobe family protein [Streptomyces sp. NBRC 14336]GLW48182.1 hypothetical protein Stsp02_38440 [Streptomyces sp. NBRC 14336]